MKREMWTLCISEVESYALATMQGESKNTL